jgi:hypothetical protein
MTRIVDLTAGNRTYWRKEAKFLAGVTYCDSETRLDIQPDKIEDFRKTSFPNGSVDVIFLDPPHSWRSSETLSVFTTPNRQMMRERFGNYDGDRPPRYYGWDKFKSREELIEALKELVVECYRILDAFGLVWLRWNEMSIPYDEVLHIFLTHFQECFRLNVSSPHKTSKIRTIWACFIRRGVVCNAKSQNQIQ